MSHQEELNERLKQAVEEAERFIVRAKIALAESTHEFTGSKSRAAAKRASMDLTRALAHFRGTDVKR
jgi:hypothetical protein